MMFNEFCEAGVEVVAGFSRDAALAAGLSTTRVRDLGRVWEAYYGPTKFTRQQRDALVFAAGMPLDQLVLIEKKLRVVADAAERWRIRLDLVRHRGSYRALSKRITRLVKVPVRAPQPACRFTKSVAGMRTMIWTYNERDIADLEHLLRTMAESDIPGAADLAHALRALLHDGAAVPNAAPRPIVLVPIPDYLRITSGTGDDITLTLTDGTTMSGAEFMQQEYGATLEVAAFHPQAGAVNLYRTSRLANGKQRTLSKLLSPACAFPDCRHAAESCQTHHMRAWKHGGMTNMNNLVQLCPHHNGANDDDRERAWRGHIDTRGGRIYWIAPNGAEVPMTTPGAMELLFD